MECKNKITQAVPTKFHFKTVEGVCGQTGINGFPVYCSSCEKKHEQVGHKPYECIHGVDVSEDDCAHCELDY